MKSIQELEVLVWQKIYQATQERNTVNISLYNSLAEKLKTIKSDLETIEQTLNGEKEPPREMHPQTLKYPPEGTLLRFVYKNREYTGVVKNHQFFIHDFGIASSISRASMMITNNPRNGWRDWYFQLPGDDRWILADDWRKG